VKEQNEINSQTGLMQGKHVKRPASVSDKRFQRLRASCCLAVVVTLQVGCSGPTAPEHSARPQKVRHSLSPKEAAELAAKVANDECARLYRQRPFRARQHPAVMKDDLYRWGGLNEGGRGGFSALVILGADGSHPQVEVYFSTDAVIPFHTQPPVPEKAEPRRR
jgi:hypothetical protein